MDRNPPATPQNHSHFITCDDDNDVSTFENFRKKHIFNPILSYYNINSLRNKIADMRIIMMKCLPDVLVIAETKLDHQFPTNQFLVENYYEPTRVDDSSVSGGLIEYTRKGMIKKRKPLFELKSFSSICSELTVNNVKWLLLSFYRKPYGNNIDLFFTELFTFMNLATSAYDNIIIMGDINIDNDDLYSSDYRKLSDFCDIFSLKNLVKDKTCFTYNNQSSIDVILTNKMYSFQHTSCYELGISDCHKLIMTSLKMHIKRLKPKKVMYRSYRNFCEESFLKELKESILPVENQFSSTADPNAMYDALLDIVTFVLDKHAPQKMKMLRGNHGKFMNRDLSKAIMTRSRLKSLYNKNPTPANRKSYKNQRNLCVALKRNAIRQNFTKATQNGTMSRNDFYKLISPYMTNKGGLQTNDIILLENNHMYVDDKDVANIFVNHYTNIVENTTGVKPVNIEDSMPPDSPRTEIIMKIIDSYKNHPSILEINKNVSFETRFAFSEITNEYVKTLFNKINIKKSTGADNLPPKITKLCTDILSKPTTFIVNSMIKNSIFPDKAKRAAISPIFKNDDRSLKINYRPLSVLPCFSKIFENVLKDQLTPHFDKFLSVYLTAYRKNFSSQHMLLRLIESWKKQLDSSMVVGAVLMDLSKAFDCIPHDLLVAKFYAYGFDISALCLIHSYLKNRFQSVRINSVYSVYLLILSGVPQGSILGPIFFNIFINDFIMFLKNSDPFNFADDNTLASCAKFLKDVVFNLESECDVSIDWLNSNNMIANPSKFHAIFLSKDKNIITSEVPIRIKDKTIHSESTVKLIGITIDDKLKFDKHINKLCKRASGQLNQLFRLKRYVEHEERIICVNSFIFSNFNYCPLIWHFTSASSTAKIEKIQERAIRFLYDDHNTPYEELLKKSNKVKMTTSRLRTLCLEIYKTLNDLNPSYMKDIFKKRENRHSNRHNYIDVPMVNQVTYGKHSMRSLGPKIWNSLPEHIKSSDTLSIFKKSIKTWDGDTCNCSFCR